MASSSNSQLEEEVRMINPTFHHLHHHQKIMELELMAREMVLVTNIPVEVVEARVAEVVIEATTTMEIAVMTAMMILTRTRVMRMKMNCV